MISSPEMACLIGEFACSVKKRQDTEFNHRELAEMRMQINFAQDVKSLKRAIRKWKIHLVKPEIIAPLYYLW